MTSPTLNQAPSLAERVLVITCVIASYSIDFTLLTVVTPIFPHLQHTLGVSDLQIGYMFAMKPAVQMLADPLIAPLVNRGYNWLIILGLLLEVITSVSLAFSTSFLCFLLLRGLQGIASAMIITTGMAWVARAHAHDDQARGTALSLVMMGMAGGTCIGPTLGGLLYEAGGMRLTFVTMAVLASSILGLNALAMACCINFERRNVTSQAEVTGEVIGFAVILRDPFMWIVYGSILVGNSAIGMLEPTLGLYMGKLGYSELAVGLSFLGITGPVLLFSPIAAKLGNQFGRSSVVLSGLIILGTGYALISVSDGKIWGIILALVIMGAGISCIDAASAALLVQLVDLRHDSSMYGSTYAIRGVAESAGFVVGPLIASGIMGAIGFRAMSIVLGCCIALYAPLLVIVHCLSGLKGTSENETQTHGNAEKDEQTSGNDAA